MKWDAGTSDRWYPLQHTFESNYPAGTQHHDLIYSLSFLKWFLYYADIEENAALCASTNKTFLNQEHGYFFSTILRYFRPQRCPFRIRAQPGQRIRFDIYDFTMTDNYLRGVQTNIEENCPVVTLFTENGESTMKSLCDGRTRERHVYTSSGHTVDVELILRQSIDTSTLFLIKYKGKWIIFPYFWLSCSQWIMLSQIIKLVNNAVQYKNKMIKGYWRWFYLYLKSFCSYWMCGL